VIVTRVGSIPESVRDGITGLVVPPRDERALAQAMVALLTDDTRRAAMARAAAEMADGELSWATVARRTVPILERLAARGPAASRPARSAVLSSPAGRAAPGDTEE
jgi:glycosyltransferase involved in cell wall biosynthesis